MPGTPDVTSPVTCFYTNVRNISGHTLSFGFLGTHGKRLAAGEQFTVRGDIRDRLASNKRKWDAMQRAVAGFTDQDGNSVAATLAISSTPAVHLYDAHTAEHDTMVLSVDNDVLGISAPCWGNYTSS